MKKAAILAIGTELTTGQIINRNPAWLAERLTDLGYSVVLHETVADDRPMILEALQRCEAKANLIFTTGGLGPTSDDFTRDLIAEWSGQKMEFHEPSWQWIVDRLNERKVPLVESQKQQCYYPKGSEVLRNPAGTAQAFLVQKGPTTIIVLPGPPREIDSIWKTNDLPGRLLKLGGADLERTELLTWDCLGISEAQLGELAEAAVAGSGLTTGYREHLPYIEVKLWIPEGTRTQNQKWIAALESAIAPFTVAKNREDLAQVFASRLSSFAPEGVRLEIIDLATGGAITERLSPILASLDSTGPASRVSIQSHWVRPLSREDLEAQTQEALSSVTSNQIRRIVIAGITPDGDWRIATRRKALDQTAPYRTHAAYDRSRKYLAEVFLKLAPKLIEEAT